MTTQPTLVEEDDRDLAIEYARRNFYRRYRQCIKVTKVVGIDDIPDVSEEDGSGLNFDAPWYQNTLYAVDTETTGFNPSKGETIIEIAISKFSKEARGFVPEWQTLVNPEKPIPSKITEITGISNEMVEGKPTFKDVAKTVADYMKDSIWIFHNRPFDMQFILECEHRAGVMVDAPPAFCSLELARETKLGQKNNKLKTLGELFKIDIENTHRAMDDARLCGSVFLNLAKRNKKFLQMNTREAIAYFDERK